MGKRGDKPIGKVLIRRLKPFPGFGGRDGGEAGVLADAVDAVHLVSVS